MAKTKKTKKQKNKFTKKQFFRLYNIKCAPRGYERLRCLENDKMRGVLATNCDNFC